MERKWAREENLSIEKRFEIMEKMVELAREVGVWPPKDPLEGIEVDIWIAKVINSYEGTPEKDSEGSG